MCQSYPSIANSLHGFARLQDIRPSDGHLFADFKICPPTLRPSKYPQEQVKVPNGGSIFQFRKLGAKSQVGIDISWAIMIFKPQ